MSSRYERNLDYDYALRLIIIGDYNTGKTTLLNTYIRQETVNTVYDPTIGIDFASRTITAPSGDIVKLACWDTSGQENFKSIVRSYYRDVCGAFLVFDVTNRRSFASLDNWLADIRRQSSCKHHQHPILLLGTKIDKTKRQVSTDEGEEYASKNDLLYAEVNALTGDNMDTIIPLFVDKIMKLDCDSCKGIKPKNPTLSVNTTNISFDVEKEAKSPSDKTCCIIS